MIGSLLGANPPLYSQSVKMYEDLQGVNPTISVVTPSLNHGRFLRQTIESVASQSFRGFEHIVVDGGSTDETRAILTDYPHLRWISEKDHHVLEAYQKGFGMARGRYVIQCCVSDGFLDSHWFRKCLDVLEKDNEVSLVWGFAQAMSEEGDLLNVSFQDFFSDPPPQKQEFFAFWLASGMCLPEGNYCVRTEVLRRCFPDQRSEGHFQVHCHLGFMYHFMMQGYSPYFLPLVANFGRTHHDQRSQRLKRIEKPAYVMYREAIRRYKNQVLSGKAIHCFRDGDSRIERQISGRDLWRLRRQVWRHQILRSRLLRTDPYTLGLKVKERLK